MHFKLKWTASCLSLRWSCCLRGQRDALHQLACESQGSKLIWAAHVLIDLNHTKPVLFLYCQPPFLQETPLWSFSRTIIITKFKRDCFTVHETTILPLGGKIRRLCFRRRNVFFIGFINHYKKKKTRLNGFFLLYNIIILLLFIKKKH